MIGVEERQWSRAVGGVQLPSLTLSARTGLMAALLLSSAAASAAPSPVTVNGLPEQIIPQASEVGLGSFTMPTGTTTVGSGTDSADGSGAGASENPDGANGGSTSMDLSGASYDTLMSRSWGPAAANVSTTMGVNPVALASTCVAESGCKDVAGSGTITGAFQMMNATYSASMAKAIADHPELANSMTAGLAGQRDPATQAIAASQYLKDAAQNLSSNGVANPTVLDARGYYNFGPGYGASISNASGSTLMSDVLSKMSAEDLIKNGVSSTTTVQQWRDGVVSKIGPSAASQSILIGA